MCGLIKQIDGPLPFVTKTLVETETQLYRGKNRGDSRQDATPRQMLTVIRAHPQTGALTPGLLRWGLIPHWATKTDIQPHNARAETIGEKPLFAEAYAKRRCVVPMDSFYERDKNGRLHRFGLASGEPFGAAGIWENWRNPRTGEWERTFAIITVDANPLVASVHDRMPAILHRTHWERWFGAEPDPRDLLQPYPADEMRKLG